MALRVCIGTKCAVLDVSVLLQGANGESVQQMCCPYNSPKMVTFV